MKNIFFLCVLFILFCHRAASQAYNTTIQRRVDSLQKELLLAKKDTAKLRLRYTIGHTAALTRLSYWDSLITDARKYRMRRLEGQALYGLGYVYFVSGLRDKSLYYFDKSYAIARETGNKADMLAPLLSIARIYYIRNEIKTAFDNCYAGLKIAEETHDTLNIANFYMGTALCYLSTGEISKSIELNRKALRLYEKLDNHEGIARSLIEIGTDYHTLNQFDKKISYYLASKKYAAEFEGTLFSREINNSVGAAYQNMGQYDSAYKYCRKAYKTALGTGNNLYIVSAMITMAGINYQMGDNAEGRKMGEQALQLSKTTHFTLQLPEIYDLLKNIYIKEKNYKKAMEAYELYVSTTDSLHNATNRKQAFEKEFNYSLQKKESENKLLAQQNKIQSLQLVVMGGLVVLVLIIALLFFRQNKFKNEQKSILLEQKLLRSQMNPHFIFNSLQAIQGFIVNRDEKEAVKYLGSFATVTRHVLESSRMESVSLDKEISLLKSYLHLQKLRFGNRFDYTIAIGSDINTENFKIPPMLLQPFIENAIEHGMQDIENDGLIEICYLLKNNMLVMEVSDNGNGMKEKQPGKNYPSRAIEITRERMMLINKRQKVKASFNISEAFPQQVTRKGVKVSFHFPVDLL